MKTLFKIEFEMLADGKLSEAELRKELKRRLDDFIMYNEDDEEVEVSIPNFWDNLKTKEL